MNRSVSQAIRIRRESAAGFTILEILVAGAVLVIVALVLMELTESTMKVTNWSHRRMAADAGARQALDRIGADFDRLVYRTDLPDLIEKNGGNDRLLFFTQAEGYEGDRGVSLVSYDAPESALRRGALGFTWSNVSGSAGPLKFNAAAVAAIPPGNFEVLAEDVFRFEVAFLLTDGSLVKQADRLVADSSGPAVQALVVGLVALDRSARKLLTADQEQVLAASFADAADGKDLLQQWEGALDGKDLPLPALNAVRVYQRYYYLKFRPAR
jgi:type II secretory pathway pseudopilin PulG